MDVIHIRDPLPSPTSDTNINVFLCGWNWIWLCLGKTELYKSLFEFYFEKIHKVLVIVMLIWFYFRKNCFVRPCLWQYAISATQTGWDGRSDADRLLIMIHLLCLAAGWPSMTQNSTFLLIWNCLVVLWFRNCNFTFVEREVKTNDLRPFTTAY